VWQGAVYARMDRPGFANGTNVSTNQTPLAPLWWRPPASWAALPAGRELQGVGRDCGKSTFAASAIRLTPC